jgi:hypothetical protein
MTLSKTYYSTKIGAYWDPSWYNMPTLYFASASDLMDHLQNVYECTADEIEFSPAWKRGEIFEIHSGSIDSQFCANHNAGKMDLEDPYAPELGEA